MKNIGRYILILVAVLVLWNTMAMKPLKIFTVYLHELGHATMAFLFGYGVKSFHVSLNESGYVIAGTKGLFSSIMIANGGYLGSLLFALLILYLKRTPISKYVLGTIAIVFLAVAIRYSGFTETLLFPVLFAAAVLILYMSQNAKIYDWSMDIIGISSVAYAIYDTFVDTILLQLNRNFHFLTGWKGTSQVTDAVTLSRLTHIPAIVWGFFWFAVSLFAVYVALIKSPSKGSKSKSK